MILWEAADRICGKRLKAAIPAYLEAMERHGHLKLDDVVREQLQKVSASTIDRLLAPNREQAGRRKRRRTPPNALKNKVEIRTFADWDGPSPGYFEADFVAHCGGNMAGSFAHTLTATDVASGWTVCVPLIVREQSLVVAALEVIRGQLPITMLGLDTDNDSAFINKTLIAYCETAGIEFTRSRPYRKNDQAWVEQKNSSVVRRFVGYDRFQGMTATLVLSRLFCAANQYVNFFQPSFKLRAKKRTGAKVHRAYYPPETPCDRLLHSQLVSGDAKQRLTAQRQKLDPVQLLSFIRQAQSELAAIASRTTDTQGEVVSLEQFASSLSTLWQYGESRPTHRKAPKKPRTYRTRKDPFDKVWALIGAWLQDDPDATAKALLHKIIEHSPGEVTLAQLRTLQRRVKQWRRERARQLISASTNVMELTPGTWPSKAATKENTPNETLASIGATG